MAHFSGSALVSRSKAQDTTLLDLADLANESTILIHALRMQVEGLGNGDDENALALITNLAFEKATEIKLRIEDLHRRDRGVDGNP